MSPRSDEESKAIGELARDRAEGIRAESSINAEFKIQNIAAEKVVLKKFTMSSRSRMTIPNR
jgi:hypothetical protein